MTDMTIGKVADVVGVGVETIRFYERRKLIEQPPRPRAVSYTHLTLPTICSV